jgi:aldose 1-epimerase
MKFLVLVAKAFATCKAILSGGGPFDVLTALWPTNEEGKYVIQAEGIRLAFSNHGAALSNFWINNTNGEEIDIVLGLDHADSYLGTKSNPFLNGFIGKRITFLTSYPSEAQGLGRYAGYIRGASYEAEGTTFPLWANAHNGTSTYNVGDNGWGRRNWAVPARTENSITFVMFDRMQVNFSKHIFPFPNFHELPLCSKHTFWAKHNADSEI